MNEAQQRLPADGGREVLFDNANCVCMPLSVTQRTNFQKYMEAMLAAEGATRQRQRNAAVPPHRLPYVLGSE